jgi:high-affinity iron transporter
MTAVVLVLALLVVPARADGDAERGARVYRANCLACHGAEADGKGPAAAALRPAPANLADPAFWDGKDDEAVKRLIRTGKPGTAMVAYAQIGETDLDDLVAWLRSRATATD